MPDKLLASSGAFLQLSACRYVHSDRRNVVCIKLCACTPILIQEQYHMVYKAVLTYLDSFDTYANFQSCS